MRWMALFVGVGDRSFPLDGVAPGRVAHKNKFARNYPTDAGRERS